MLTFRIDMNTVSAPEYAQYFQSLWIEYHSKTYEFIGGIDISPYFAIWAHYQATLAAEGHPIPDEHQPRLVPRPEVVAVAADPANGIAAIAALPYLPANINGGLPYPTTQFPNHTAMFGNAAQSQSRADEVKNAYSFREKLEAKNTALKEALEKSLPVSFIERLSNNLPSPGNPNLSRMTAKQLIYG